MSKKEKILETNALPIVDSPRPRLHKLIVKNFRCINSSPVEIELDDVVVLVGQNNVGKSSILKAYEIAMSEGSAKAHLEIDDFPNSKIDPNNLPEIELHTIVFDDAPASDWIEKININGKTENLVKEKWIWDATGGPKRFGWSMEKSGWSNTGDGGVPWGAPNIANTRRPEPHRVGTFDSPDEQAKQIIAILVAILEERVKNFKDEPPGNGAEENEYIKLLGRITDIRKKLIADSKTEIDNIEKQLGSLIEKVFPGYEVKFDAKPEDDVEKTISIIKSNPELLMGPAGQYQSSVEKQGSGARRTLLWAALKIISENSQGKKDKKVKQEKENLYKRPQVLLLDEPEICLHPAAIRQASNVLYDLPASGNWQVIMTTHSPIFIDLSKDNTTIIRVDRNAGGNIEGSTLFRPKQAQLTTEDKENLKLMNLFDPYVAEFFFGGKVIVVEGDTEYSAFKYIISKFNEKIFNNVHIIRARGKATIVSLMKILNHFGADYAILHDADLPTVKREDKNITNPAWSLNQKIIDETVKKDKDKKIRVVASLPNFERAYLSIESPKRDKPYAIIEALGQDDEIFKKIKKLLLALIDFSEELPDNCVEWNDLNLLEELVRKL